MLYNNNKYFDEKIEDSNRGKRNNWDLLSGNSKKKEEVNNASEKEEMEKRIFIKLKRNSLKDVIDLFSDEIEDYNIDVLKLKKEVDKRASEVKAKTTDTRVIVKKERLIFDDENGVFVKR